MGIKNRIEHEGVVLSADTQKAKVLIEQTSACAGCHAKGACTAFDKDEKIIDALVLTDQTFHIGERVMIVGQRSIGVQAVLMAFVVPFVLIIAVLAIVLAIAGNELYAALGGLLVLLPYYLLIYLMRERIQREFKFYVEKK